MNYNCHQKEKLEASVEDIKCFQCKKKFLTQNLFEWHGNLEKLFSFFYSFIQFQF